MPVYIRILYMGMVFCQRPKQTRVSLDPITSAEIDSKAKCSYDVYSILYIRLYMKYHVHHIMCACIYHMMSYPACIVLYHIISYMGQVISVKPKHKRRYRSTPSRRQRSTQKPSAPIICKAYYVCACT